MRQEVFIRDGGSNTILTVSRRRLLDEKRLFGGGHLLGHLWYF